MTSSKFQKMGGVVASLVSILAFSSPAKALTFSSPTSTYSIPDNNATGVTASIAISGQGNITSFDSVTISGFTHTGYTDLRAFVYNGTTTVQLFRTSAAPDNAIFPGTATNLSGNYTFATTGASWYTPSNNIVPSGTTYASFDPLSAFVGSSLNGTWTLNVQDLYGGEIGSFSAFSIDVNNSTPVPFEFSHSASLVILGGTWLVLRGLKKKSAEKMLAKSLNS